MSPIVNNDVASGFPELVGHVCCAELGIAFVKCSAEGPGDVE
jgi:hypothetical protein